MAVLLNKGQYMWYPPWPYVHKQLQAIFFSTTPDAARWKSIWRKDRQPADTKFRPQFEENYVKERKAFGGRKKLKALKMVSGNYLVKSQGIGGDMRILDVVHSDAGAKFRDKKIIAKSTYLLVDATPIMDNINHGALTSSISKDLVESMNQLIGQNRLFAKVTSRPGQDGTVNGYIVEGGELVSLLEKLKLYEKKSVV